jgi:hypothetical protein
MRQAKDLEEQQAHGSCTRILPHEFTSADISRPNCIVRMFWAGNGTDDLRKKFTWGWVKTLVPSEPQNSW